MTIIDSPRIRGESIASEKTDDRDRKISGLMTDIEIPTSIDVSYGSKLMSRDDIQSAIDSTEGAGTIFVIKNPESKYEDNNDGAVIRESVADAVQGLAEAGGKSMKLNSAG